MLPKEWNTTKSTYDTVTSSQNATATQDNTQKSSSGFRPAQAVDRAITARLSTPHDAVLAGLQGQRPDVNTSAKVDAESVALPTIPSLGSLERVPGAPSPVQGASARSAVATPTNGSPEPIYDPFSGTLAYIIPPQTPNDAESSHFEQTKDELWGQLGRIRELQSEIAGMHVQMEGVGQSDGRNPKKGQTRAHSDTIMGDEWPDADQIEQELHKARDVEFEGLAKAFEGRHAAIGKIMNKVCILSAYLAVHITQRRDNQLDDLSKTLTAFHALPTPAMVFPARNPTKDSSTPMFSNPSPTLTSPSSPSPMSPIDGSPTFTSAAVPYTLQTELAKIDIPGTDSPESS